MERRAGGALGRLRLLDTLVAAGAAALYVCHPASGADLDAQLAAIARGWDDAWYHIESDAAQVTALHLLEVQTVVLIRDCPDDARPRVWLGVILASEADASDWLAAISRAAQARDILQDAETATLDDETRATLESALGALYTQAPPFPISFGDAHQAERHLRRALAAEPDGIEPNFYEGDLLFREHRYEEAARAFAACLRAPTRPKCGRRRDARRSARAAW
jgi:tetratricopeptide (TPR) repeat protein